MYFQSGMARRMAEAEPIVLMPLVLLERVHFDVIVAFPSENVSIGLAAAYSNVAL